LPWNRDGRRNCNRSPNFENLVQHGADETYGQILNLHLHYGDLYNECAQPHGSMVTSVEDEAAPHSLRDFVHYSCMNWPPVSFEPLPMLSISGLSLDTARSVCGHDLALCNILVLPDASIEMRLQLSSKLSLEGSMCRQHKPYLPRFLNNPWIDSSGACDGHVYNPDQKAGEAESRNVQPPP